MESLKEYRPSIINKLKLFLSRIEQRKTIEKDLDKLDISLFSSNNIDYIIQNKEKFDFKKYNEINIQKLEKIIN